MPSPSLTPLIFTKYYHAMLPLRYAATPAAAYWRHERWFSPRPRFAAAPLPLLIAMPYFSSRAATMPRFTHTLIRHRR